MSALEEFKKARKTYEEIVASKGKDVVKELVLPYLAAQPKVKAVRWRQYTPWFNDGDTCEFSVREPVAILEETDDEPEYGEPEYEEIYEDDNWCSVSGEIQGLGDMLKDAFGDHVEVTVTRTGVEVEECNHD